MEAKCEQEFTVNGLTCGHCAQALTAALVVLDGVLSADVDATTGRVILHTAQLVDPEAIGGAVTEAGFELIVMREHSQ